MGDTQEATRSALGVRERFLEKVTWNLGIVVQLIKSLL